jgi:hypothetical protein
MGGLRFATEGGGITSAMKKTFALIWILFALHAAAAGGLY